MFNILVQKHIEATRKVNIFLINYINLNFVLTFFLFLFISINHSLFDSIKGNIMKYEGKEKYELKLDQIKNTPTANKSVRKMELNNYEIKPSSKKEWNIACIEADAAMNLDRARRIETLTFEYILDAPKSIKKRTVEVEDYDIQSTPSSVKKRKADNQNSSTKASTSKSKSSTILSKSLSKTAIKTPTTPRKKSIHSISSPADVYDFNEFADEFEDETPTKFELSSAKRAKGEYLIYAKQLRDDVEKKNPDLNAEEIDQKLKRNWELMSEDMRNSYAPRPSLFQNNLSFQLDSPDKNNSSLNQSSILDTSTSSVTKTAKSPQKTYGGRKAKSRKASLKKADKQTNGSDFEKENNADEEMEDSNVEQDDNKPDDNKPDDNKSDDIKPNEEKVTVESTNRRSSRKKVFNQGNESVTETETENVKSIKTTANETTNSRRQSTRMKKSPVKPTKESDQIEKQQIKKVPSIEESTTAKSTNSIKKRKSQTTGDENGEDFDSVSCSSESEKTEQSKDENKERVCGKCGELSKGLIKCEGECLEHYHKECLHQDV